MNFKNLSLSVTLLMPGALHAMLLERAIDFGSETECNQLLVKATLSQITTPGTFPCRDFKTLSRFYTNSNARLHCDAYPFLIECDKASPSLEDAAVHFKGIGNYKALVTLPRPLQNNTEQVVVAYKFIESPSLFSNPLNWFDGPTILKSSRVTLSINGVEHGVTYEPAHQKALTLALIATWKKHTFRSELDIIASGEEDADSNSGVAE